MTYQSSTELKAADETGIRLQLADQTALGSVWLTMVTPGSLRWGEQRGAERGQSSVLCPPSRGNRRVPSPSRRVYLLQTDSK